MSPNARPEVQSDQGLIPSSRELPMKCDRRRQSLLVPLIACAAMAAAMLALSHALAADSPAPVAPKPVPAGERADYNRDIQPILPERCYFRHGPPPRQRE